MANTPDNILVITVQDGLLFYKTGKDVSVRTADAIAQANGELYAERFVKKYDGETVLLDAMTRKIVSHRKGVATCPTTRKS